MKSFLVIGLGRFGRQIVKKLDELNYEVLAVDVNEDRVQAVLPFATNAQIGDSTDANFLSSLGVSNFDVCIVAIGDNFQNSLETTSLLKELHAPVVVSRAASDVHAKFLSRNGADHVVYPEEQLANWTAIRYSSDHVLDYIQMEQDFSIYEVEIPKNWVGRTVQQINIRKEHQLNIVAVKNEGRLDPEIGPDYCFSGNETIWVIGKNKNIQKCFHI